MKSSWQHTEFIGINALICQFDVLLMCGYAVVCALITRLRNTNYQVLTARYSLIVGVLLLHLFVRVLREHLVF